ncbi:MAG: hypothetical protein K8F92_00905 [Hyphomicrobium sp.]|uniref:hypothetical protein n=1 Tax=Hyphomicrobium sp. TaxID=82 RepID=UPI0022BDA512|nr:hypothetical protein [Hyphomicrobium sp.]MBZ0208201.1 hypothetical protein [Hyphomicrobium sp.]MCZ7594913.1 hypothetical protein [Hyphomicrobium sp.]
MKEAWQRIWQWLCSAAYAMDYDPVEELQNRVTSLEAEVAEIKGARLQDGR